MSVSDQILDKLRKNDKNLTELSMSGNSVGDEGAQALAKAIESNIFLESLEIGNSDIGSEGAKALAKALTKNQHLKTLYLRGNFIGDEGSKALSDALKINNSLQHLYLGNNKITIKGINAFAEAFPFNSALNTIYLRNNSVGDSGAQILSDSLVKNCGLRVLNLANVGLTKTGCETLLNLLNINTTLHSVVFEHNGVNDTEIITAFEEKFKYNESLPVVTSNNIVKKIVQHCELQLELDETREDQKQAILDKIAQQCILSRAEQYHWSGNNLQGNSILCVAFLSRLINGKYSNDSKKLELIASTFRKLFEAIITRAKQDITNPKTIKPRAEILQMAQNFIG